MSNRWRIFIGLDLLIVAVVLFFVLRDGGDDGGSTSEPIATTPTVEREQPAPEKPARPVVETVVVRGGQPVGGVAELEFSAGERVRFRVTADAPEEIHVHGYDIERPVGPGRPAEFDFPGDLEGVFEVELHGTAVTIAEISVTP